MGSEMCIRDRNKCGKLYDELPVEGSKKDTVLQCEFVDKCKAMDMKQTSNFIQYFERLCLLHRGARSSYVTPFLVSVPHRHDIISPCGWLS